MRSSFGLSTCPSCHAIYHVLKVEAGPETKDEKARCRACGAPLPARQGLIITHHVGLAIGQGDRNGAIG
jgi:predicted Zn finger-like uncharacterized protein